MYDDVEHEISDEEEMQIINNEDTDLGEVDQQVAPDCSSSIRS